MRHTLLAVLLIGSVCYAASSADIARFDKKIKELKDARARAEMQAYIYGNAADQHLSQDFEDYIQDIDEQAHYQQKVQELNEDITALEHAKAKLQSSN